MGCFGSTFTASGASSFTAAAGAGCSVGCVGSGGFSCAAGAACSGAGVGIVADAGAGIGAAAGADCGTLTGMLAEGTSGAFSAAAVSSSESGMVYAFACNCTRRCCSACFSSARRSSSSRAYWFSNIRSVCISSSAPWRTVETLSITVSAPWRRSLVASLSFALVIVPLAPPHDCDQNPPCESFVPVSVPATGRSSLSRSFSFVAMRPRLTTTVIRPSLPSAWAISPAGTL